MSNFLDILCLSIFCSKDKDRQASKWGGSPYLPFASLSGPPSEQTSARFRAFVRCWFDYHVRSAKALRLGQPSVLRLRSTDCVGLGCVGATLHEAQS